MIFIRKQILRVVSFALRRANFSQHKNLKSILLLWPSPLGTPTGRCPCNPLGARDPDPQTPSPPAWGGSSPQCRLLTCILLPLEIILTSLETSGSVAKCQLFSKARYTCILIKEDVIHFRLKADQICLIQSFYHTKAECNYCFIICSTLNSPSKFLQSILLCLSTSGFMFFVFFLTHILLKKN